MENGETEPSLCGKDARSLSCGVGRVRRGGRIVGRQGKPSIPRLAQVHTLQNPCVRRLPHHFLHVICPEWRVSSE